MPNQNKMLIVRPKNCHFCGNGYYGLGHVIDQAVSYGWDVTDLQAEQAVKEQVINTIQQEDPGYYYGFGHGSNCVYTGDNEQEIFSCGNTQILADRTIYLLSCLTAVGLGPDIMAKGGTAYAGYNIEWTWITENGTDGDPYQDRYARGMYESANELWVAVIEHDSFSDAVQRGIDKYNQWIDYWIYENPEDPYSQEAIRWLAWDRDGLVMLMRDEPCEDGTIKCFGRNLYVCENNQWVFSEENSSECRYTTNLVVAIPIIIVIGIAFIAMMGPKKKRK